MTLEATVVGLIGLGVGAALCFAGIRLFLILLPVWGAVVGFVFGATAVTAAFGEGFLSTALGIVAGVVAGLVMAVLSYLFYGGAVLILGGSLGYLLAIAVMDVFGIGGLVAFLVALVAAGVFAVGFLALDMPVWLAVWGTAIGGATAIVGGLALLLGRVPLSALDGGTLGAALADTQWPWLWFLAVIGLSVAGAVIQTRTVDERDAITADRYRNPGLP
jgi:hypothetical protein